MNKINSNMKRNIKTTPACHTIIEISQKHGQKKINEISISHFYVSVVTFHNTVLVTIKLSQIIFLSSFLQ